VNRDLDRVDSLSDSEAARSWPWEAKGGLTLYAEPVQHRGMASKRKNPAAVALGRRGGKQSGKARMKKMTPEQRSEVARTAALTRWRKEH